jgi:hypothetical protein
MDVSKTQYFNADGFTEFGGLGLLDSKRTSNSSVPSGTPRTFMRELNVKKDEMPVEESGTLGASIVSGGLSGMREVEQKKDKKDEKRNTMVYVGLGVAYLLLVVVIIKATKK